MPRIAYARIWKTELIATRSAPASRSPQARSFQMSTMAMQRARPITMRPVRKAGSSGRKIQASANISAGPMSQLRMSDSHSIRRSPVKWPMSSYFTRARTGYIIAKRPMAIGRLVWSTLTASRAVLSPGTTRPRRRPAPMASAIHRGRNRSRVDRRATTAESAGSPVATRLPWQLHRCLSIWIRARTDRVPPLAPSDAGTRLLSHRARPAH